MCLRALGLLFPLFFALFSTSAGAVCGAEGAFRPRTEAALLAELRQDPENSTILECLAGVIEDRGELIRAEFLRAVAKRTRDPLTGRVQFSPRMVHILESHYREIAPGLPEVCYGKSFRESALDFFSVPGFVVVKAELNRHLIEKLPDLFRPLSPVFGLELLPSQDPIDFEAGEDFNRAYHLLPEFLQRSELAFLVSLEFFQVPATHQAAFLNCPHLTHLRRLIFGTNSIVETRTIFPFVVGLTTSAITKHLRYLYVPFWGFNPGTPRITPQTLGLFKKYLLSENFFSVRNSPLIYPGATPLSTATIPRPPRPYISQAAWENRFGTCEKKLRAKR